MSRGASVETVDDMHMGNKDEHIKNRICFVHVLLGWLNIGWRLDIWKEWKFKKLLLNLQYKVKD